jgi:hypothetical protein
VASKSLEEGELENEYVVCGVFLSRMLLSLSPLWLGVRPPFYRSRVRRITCAPRYLATWGNTTCYAVVGGRPDDPCSDLAMMAYLVPEQWRFEGRRAADGGDVL